MVEDASNDGEATLVVQTTFNNSIFLTTIKDGPSHSMVEDNTEPRLVEDPSIETMSSLSSRAREDEDLACPSLAPLSINYNS